MGVNGLNAISKEVSAEQILIRGALVGASARGSSTSIIREGVMDNFVCFGAHLVCGNRSARVITTPHETQNWSPLQQAHQFSRIARSLKLRAAAVKFQKSVLQD
jgi:hypothetical protein